MNLPLLIAGFLILFIFIGAGYLIFSITKAQKKAERELLEREKALKREAYEAEILRELGERFGYELDERKIVDIITNSIGKLFSYSTVASLLVSGEELKFKIHLEESVSDEFIITVKQKLTAAFQALSEEKYKNLKVVEEKTGTVVDNSNQNPVGSFFNIPIVIDEKLAGVLNISSTQPGLYKEDEMTILYKIVGQASTAVTKLKHVLETEKGKLSSMVESMSEGVIMVDNDTRVQVINPAAREFLEIEEEEPSIFTVLDILKPKIDLREQIVQAKKKNQMQVVEELVLGDRVVKLFVSPVKDRRDKIIGGVIAFHDISKEKELERLREDFTAMMVHELRSPLTAVRGASVSLLDHQDFPEEKKKEYLKMIQESSENMLEIVSNLLDVAKIEADKFRIDPKPAPVNQLISKKAEEYEPLAQEKGLDLESRLPEKEIEVEMDSKRIGQVINNLLSNAIKFTSKGKVTISLEDGEDKVRVSVIDTGPGIEAQDQEKLFSKFGQLESNLPRTAEGTGLGLVIAKGIVEAHGGAIGIKSKKGEGSTFFFTLPKTGS